MAFPAPILPVKNRKPRLRHLKRDIFVQVKCACRIIGIFSAVLFTFFISVAVATLFVPFFHLDSVSAKSNNPAPDLGDPLEPLKRIRDESVWRQLGIPLPNNSQPISSEAQLVYGPLVSGPQANIAFFLQVSDANYALVPRLLSRLWHPQNLYVLHFDAKIALDKTAAFTSAIRANSKLRNNVRIMRSAPVTYAGISMVLNTLDSMQMMLDDPLHWDYYINLSGSDYPLLSPVAIRLLLGQKYLYSSAEAPISFVHFSPFRGSWDIHLRHRFAILHFDLSLGFNASSESGSGLQESSRMHPVLATQQLSITVAKGEAWIIAHRKFCKTASQGSFARRLLTLFTNMQAPDEHFFQTLSWNEGPLNRTSAHHSFREIVWTYPGREPFPQHPHFLDDVSNAGDWLLWPRLASSPNLFARKFRKPDSPMLDYIDAVKSGATDDERDTNVTAVAQSFGIVRNRFACVSDIRKRRLESYIGNCLAAGWQRKGCSGGEMELCVEDLPPPAPVDLG